MATAKKSIKEEYESLKKQLEEASAKLDDAFGAEEEKTADEEFQKVLRSFQKASNKYFQEKVKVRLFKDSGRYADDVYVGWNGVNYQIQRGVDVEVPRGVAEIIKESEDQQQSAALTIEELSSDFEKETKKRNL